jgi:thiol:disulfide interchange protein
VEILNSGQWQMLRVDMTNNTPETQAFAQKMGVVSLPSVLILNPDGKICRAKSLYEFEEASSFLDSLKSAQQSCE